MANNMQFGTAVETTYGTPVTVERFFEILGGESLERQQTIIQTDGLRPGIKMKLGQRRQLTKQWGEGNIPMEIATTGYGRWFLNMLGAADTITNETTSVYTHTYTPGTLAGKSLTMQKGVEPWTAAGTALPFTFHGCKIVEWEIGVSVDGYALLNVGVNAEDVDISTGLAVASYGAIKNFTFKQGAVTIGATDASLASLAGVTDFTVRGTNALNVDRYFLSSTSNHEEPLEDGFRELSGSVSMEFRDQAAIYSAYAADTEKHVRLVFEGDVITGTYTELLQIDLYDVRFEGETPKISGPEPATISADFTAWEQDDGSSIRIIYRSTDATA